MTGAPPAVVIDTQVLLELWLFRDARVDALAQALAAGRLQWLACEAMRVEWQQVWPRPGLARWSPDPLVLGAVFDRARMLAPPPSGPLNCSDPADQVFIDLALHAGARRLISRDKALLALARRARALGLDIGPP